VNKKKRNENIYFLRQHTESEKERKKIEIKYTNTAATYHINEKKKTIHW